ncbi:MAG: hypothetical protein AB8B79_23635 [Granulosicoccus sp.]
MKLIFLLQKNAWFVEHEQAWYRLHDQQDVVSAVASLVLKVVDQDGLIEQPHHAGSARLKTKSRDRLMVSLTSPDGTTLIKKELVLDKQSLTSVDWQTRPHRDGWLNANAQVTVERLNDFYVNAYLPAFDGSDGKTLTVFNTADGSEKQIWLARNKQTRVQLLAKACNRKTTLQLHCEPETISQSTDSRQLGFILLGEQAKLA